MSCIKVYDVETFPNFFSYIDIDASNEVQETREFVICAWRNDIEEFKEYISELHDKKAGMVGFNNLRFDWPVVQYIWQNNPSAEQIHAYAQNIINDEKFRAREDIKQLDLFLLNHYNNKARSASLKSLEVALHWHNVMDMPFHHTHIVKESETESILDYNRNDVLFTRAFYHANEDKINLRKELSKKFKFNAINKSDVVIGEEIFVQRLSRAVNMKPFELKQIRGKRVNVPLKKIIFPYVRFESKEFKLLLDTMKDTVATSNYLDSFVEQLNTSIDTNNLQDQLEQFNVDLNKTVMKKKSFSFKTRFADLIIYYGVGGIHGCVPPGQYKADDEWDILDVDVKSYYPNLFIKNELAPRQMDKNTFVKVYSDIFDERVKAQLDKDDVTSGALKLALNGLFGKTGSDVSCFFDPEIFYSITVNGQLLISMLLEKLYGVGTQILQVNTDGVTIKHRKKDLDKILAICKEWEKLTKLTLEYANYKQMIIRDVNNYLAESTTGKIKEKGCFETKKDWHKDNSFMVVPLAVREYFINGTPVIDTLTKHRNIYDFCGRYKAGRGWHAVHIELEDNKNQKEENFGRILRFLPVKKGGYSVKRNKDGREHYLLAGYPTKPFNVKCEVKKRELNYEFFVAQCNQLIEIIQPLQMTLL